MTVRTNVLTLPRVTDWAPTLARTTVAALALALLAQVSIHLPFTPVPITLQVLGVLLLGGLLGPRVGLAAVVEYLLLGACGLPVFAGWASLSSLLYATHAFASLGYLIAFLPAVAVYGAIATRCATRRYAFRLTGGLLAGVLAVLVCYLGGWAWLAFVCRLGVEKAVVLGIVPFVVGDLYKIGIAAAALALRGKGESGCANSHGC